VLSLADVGKGVAASPAFLPQGAMQVAPLAEEMASPGFSGVS
jgi:hypothetical protein